MAALHHHLVREGTRLKIGLVAETGEAREIHHIACLTGYGASAVNPYILFESLYSLHRAGRLPDGMGPEEAARAFDRFHHAASVASFSSERHGLMRPCPSAAISVRSRCSGVEASVATFA